MIIRALITIMLSIILVSPGVVNVVYSIKISADVDQKIVSRLSREIEIPAGSDYYIKFVQGDLKLDGENIIPCSTGLADHVEDAIVKSPRWIQRDLTRQFHAIIDADEYADLILNSSKNYVDEIAFSIASSSLGGVPSVDVIRDNVFSLYENDKWIKYADIVDYDDNDGNYYSTIRYWVVENGIEKQLEYPPEIYYWYVVHMETAGEREKYVYERFWRDYYFNHNDLSYPLLKEKLSEVEYLWDCESYFQPRHRLWRWSMDNHPTAVEAISYWIGKTVPEQAYGSRPNQPNAIAHEHNGWCGELQRIAVAALRTALVPSVSVCNHGEDHVWREFYERGWHENDNWWSDGGGAVDQPDVYAYGWKKDMSAIFAWRGDDSVYEVTSRYIRPEDRVTVKFVVRDRRLQPVDGARITAMVSAPEGMTPVKNKIWNKIEKIWDHIPQWLKGEILQTIYNKFKERYEEIPEPMSCVWNYTNMDGECTLEVGKNRSYLFTIQYGNLKASGQLATYNALRFLRKPKDTTFHVVFPRLVHRIPKHFNLRMPTGEVFFNISYNTRSYQIQKNIIWIGEKGLYERDGKIDFFILDEKNFEKYKNGRRFNCYNYREDKEGDINFSARNNNWYIVFRNTGLQSNILLNFSISVETSTEIDRVQIVSPDTIIFDNPVFNVGENVVINGIATDDIILYINDTTNGVTTQGYEWFYNWDTADMQPGDYLVVAECGDTRDELLVTLRDTIPPIIEIDDPFDKEIVDKDEEIIEIAGHTWDNLGVEMVEVSLNNKGWRLANGTDNWYIHWNITGLVLGDHTISARAFDKMGNEYMDEISIAINETGHSWRPEINSFYHQPEYPNNMSNIVVYANVTQGSPFAIQKVVLYWNDSGVIESKEMYRYGDNPVQERHKEDPLKNESNSPIFGLELGQFSTDANITYWATALDTANNTRLSDKKSFKVD